MINVNQQALLELLKASLFGAEPHFPEGVDWDAVLQEAKDQTVVGLAAPGVPETEAEKWRVPVAQNKMRFFQILDEQTKLVKLFQDAGIPMVILKGCAAAMYYPEPFQRTMGDIDFIVPPERFEEARQLMMDNSYEFDHDLGNDREYTYRKGKIFLELHHHYSDAAWDIDPLIMTGLTQTVTSEIYGKAFPVLPAEINGMVLLDHVRHHLFGGLGIRQIIDWMMFVDAFMDDKTWERSFEPLLRDTGLKTFAITMTKMCKLWFGLSDDVSWCEDADEETARELFETVLDYGNFGHKTRSINTMGERIALRLRKGNLFCFLQKTGLEQWKACQRHQFLCPFAWLYQLFCYFGMGIAALFRGERMVRDYGEGKKKSDFYARLGLNR